MPFHTQQWCWIPPLNKFKIKQNTIFDYRITKSTAIGLHFCTSSSAHTPLQFYFFSRDWLQVWNTCCAGPNTYKSGWDPRRKTTTTKQSFWIQGIVHPAQSTFFSPEVFLLSFHRNHCKDVTQCMARKLLVTATVLSLSSFHSITVSLLLSNPIKPRVNRLMYSPKFLSNPVTA